MDVRPPTGLEGVPVTASRLPLVRGEPRLWGLWEKGERRKTAPEAGYYVGQVINKEVTMKRLWEFAFFIGLLVIGVFIPPTPSEAAPIVTIDGADVGAGGNLTSIDCKTYGDAALGFTECWRIKATTYNGWTVSDYDSNLNPARVLIADVSQAVGNNLDKLVWTGLKLKPTTASVGQRQTTVMTLQNTFTQANANTAGTYLFAVGAGGLFQKGDLTNIQDFVKVSGTFVDSNTPICDGCTNVGEGFSFQVGSTNTGAAVSWSLNPSGVPGTTGCATGCNQTIKQRLDITVLGPDTLVMGNSYYGAGGACDPVPPTSPPGQTGNTPYNPCKAKANKTAAFFNKSVAADDKVARDNGAEFGVQCVDDPLSEFSCGCFDPEICGE